MPHQSKLLIVDLDGTFIKSDMLQETFWSALSSNDWTVPFKALRVAFAGKARLKDYLYHSSDVDIKTLPYNPAVIAYITQHRQGGGQTALVTASNQDIAEKIAHHSGLFDEVHGSSKTHNLKGAAKAAFLNKRFGRKNYDYMGDSFADLPIWKDADKAISVGTGKALQQKCAAANPNCAHIASTGLSDVVFGAIRAIRPHQWLKNILVFCPMLAAHQFTAQYFFEAFLAFLAFCFVASSVYITNDLLDLQADRAHPRKSKRPFASGALSVAYGMIGAIILLILGGALSLLAAPAFTLVLAGYYALTSIYSYNLKRTAIIDIFTLAGLYTLRIIGGSAASDITISFWLLAFSIFIFLSLAAVKRQSELVDLRKRNKLKIAGRGYHVDDLSIVSMIALCAGFTSIIVMALYINSPEVMVLYSSPMALLAVCCLLLFWIVRMCFTANRGEMHDDPIVYTVKDRISILLFTLSFFIILGAI